MSNFQTAREIVKQIKAGEWSCKINSIDGEVHIIKKGKLSIWIGTGGGSFFCKGYEPRVDLFGIFWRHWVYREARKLCNRKPEEERQRKIESFTGGKET